MSGAPQTRSELTKLSVAALGIVYGDIGTSPLYAMRECFAQPHGVVVSHDNVLGILSLFFWALTLVIVVKYLSFVMRADNAGEGGTFALLALLDPKTIEKKEKGLETRKTDTSFFLGRETLLITDKRGMARWRKMLFAFMSRNARPANLFFRIPPNRVVELGTQIEL